MRTIQYQLPNPRHVELHKIFVKAKPEVAWAARFAACLTDFIESGYGLMEAVEDE